MVILFSSFVQGAEKENFFWERECVQSVIIVVRCSKLRNYSVNSSSTYGFSFAVRARGNQAVKLRLKVA